MHAISGKAAFFPSRFVGRWLRLPQALTQRPALLMSSKHRLGRYCHVCEVVCEMVRMSSPQTKQMHEIHCSRLWWEPS